MQQPFHGQNMRTKTNSKPPKVEQTFRPDDHWDVSRLTKSDGSQFTHNTSNSVLEIVKLTILSDLSGFGFHHFSHIAGTPCWMDFIQGEALLCSAAAGDSLQCWEGLRSHSGRYSWGALTWSDLKILGPRRIVWQEGWVVFRLKTSFFEFWSHLKSIEPNVLHTPGTFV